MRHEEFVETAVSEVGERAGRWVAHAIDVYVSFPCGFGGPGRDIMPF